MGVRPGRSPVGLASVLAALAAWELAARLAPVPTQLFPPFSGVVRALIDLTASGELPLHYVRTLARVVIGFGLGSTLGVAVGAAAAYHRLTYGAAYPLIGLLYAVPAVAWIPLFMLWVGLGEALPVTVVFMCSFPPTAYATLTGARSVDAEMIRVARTLGAEGLTLLREVVLPQALPHILSGLKVEAGMAWRTCFVTEMVAMSSGLGLLAMEAQSVLRVDQILAVVLVLAASNYAFSWAFERLELSILRRRGAG